MEVAGGGVDEGVGSARLLLSQAPPRTPFRTFGKLEAVRVGGILEKLEEA